MTTAGTRAGGMPPRPLGTQPRPPAVCSEASESRLRSRGRRPQSHSGVTPPRWDATPGRVPERQMDVCRQTPSGGEGVGKEVGSGPPGGAPDPEHTGPLGPADGITGVLMGPESPDSWGAGDRQGASEAQMTVTGRALWPPCTGGADTPSPLKAVPTCLPRVPVTHPSWHRAWHRGARDALLQAGLGQESGWDTVVKVQGRLQGQRGAERGPQSEDPPLRGDTSGE